GFFLATFLGVAFLAAFLAGLAFFAGFLAFSLLEARVAMVRLIFNRFFGVKINNSVSNNTYHEKKPIFFQIGFQHLAFNHL
ncbi:MAG: hypothetical protein ACK5DJ_02480, partial [Bacteroidota bacterium]